VFPQVSLDLLEQLGKGEPFAELLLGVTVGKQLTQLGTSSMTTFERLVGDEILVGRPRARVEVREVLVQVAAEELCQRCSGTLCADIGVIRALGSL
jgi:hypothetical protein